MSSDAKENGRATSATPNVPEGHELIKEGTAFMIFPKSKNSVFYNPVQVQNRDLSVLMITLYAERRARRLFLKKKRRVDKVSAEDAERAASEIDWAEYVRTNGASAGETLDGLRVLDALAASGLRSVRYRKEIPGVAEVVANDLEEAAVATARRSLELNGVPETEGVMSVRRGDAVDLLHASAREPRPFDVIDLDPYGSAAPFLDAAVRGVADGGLLCVTCTDTTALAGSKPELCFGRYGAMPIQRARYLQEAALRILLQSLSRIANQYGRTIHPVLSVGMAFYVRVFVEVRENKAGVLRSSLNVGHVYQSTRCDTFYTIPQGSFNGSSYKPGRTATIADNVDPDDASGRGKRRKKKRKNKGTPKQEEEKEKEKEKKETSTTEDQKETSTTTTTTTKEPPPPPRITLPDPFCCPETGAPFKIGGPLWLAPIHDLPTVEAAVALLDDYEQRTTTGTNDGSPSDDGDDDDDTPRPVFQTLRPLRGLLVAVSEELPDVPLYYTLPGLCSTARCTAPPAAVFRAALRNAGYRESAYHKEPDAVKTDAPPEVVWDVVRAWCERHPVAEKHRTGTDAAGLLHRRGMRVLRGEKKKNDDDDDDDRRRRVDFTVRDPPKRRKACRYPMNPQKNWGPKPRAASARKRSHEAREEGTTPNGNDDPAKKKSKPPSAETTTTTTTTTTE